MFKVIMSVLGVLAVGGGIAVSDQVLAIVEPHCEQLMGLHALAWFGL